MTREDLIEQGVRFLQHPKVQNTTMSERLKFLEKKGLTPLEISKALEKAEKQSPASSVSTGRSIKSLTSSQPGERLKGRIVLVLGGNRGIGQLISIRCAKEGAQIVVVDSIIKENVSTASEIRKYSDDVFEVDTRLENANEIDRVFTEIVGKYGRLDVVINCLPLVYDCQKSLLNTTESDGNDFWNTFSKSIVFTAKKAIQQMLTQNKDSNGVCGRIVHVSLLPSGLLHGLAHGLLKQFTKQLSEEFFEKGIVVNSIVYGTKHADVGIGVADSVLFLSTDESSVVQSLKIS